MSENISEQLRSELDSFNFCFPIMGELAKFFQQTNHIRGKRIGWHCHLTSITAATAEVMLAAGAQLHLSECNPHTTDADSVSYMRSLGAAVHTGKDSIDKVLSAHPQITSDTGFALTGAAIACGQTTADEIFAGSEITTSGITAMRALPAVPLPIININDGQLKTFIENFHGVGDGVVDALFKATGRMWSGRPAAVIGYGRVGAGVAHYLRHSGAVVNIVESDPVRRLVAHYDGYAVTDLESALEQSELLVTATGQAAVVPGAAWSKARKGLLVMNVGHWSSEIDSLQDAALSRKPVTPHMERLQLAHADVFLIAQGSPANVVMLTGSVEPTLIHLTTEMLCVNYLAECLDKGARPAPGEHAVPAAVERQASLLALSALGIHQT